MLVHRFTFTDGRSEIDIAFDDVTYLDMAMNKIAETDDKWVWFRVGPDRAAMVHTLYLSSIYPVWVNTIEVGLPADSYKAARGIFNWQAEEGLPEDAGKDNDGD